MANISRVIDTNVIRDVLISWLPAQERRAIAKEFVGPKVSALFAKLAFPERPQPLAVRCSVDPVDIDLMSEDFDDYVGPCMVCGRIVEPGNISPASDPHQLSCHEVLTFRFNVFPEVESLPITEALLEQLDFEVEDAWMRMCICVDHPDHTPHGDYCFSILEID